MLLRTILLSKHFIKALRLNNHCVCRRISAQINVHKSIDNIPDYLSFSKAFDSDSKTVLSRDMLVIDNFVSDAEEVKLMEELTPVLNQLHYEFDHWDDAIHGYRETEKLDWNEDNVKIINRVREVAFPPNSSHLSQVHVLDLSEKGWIKPHIDSIRFCGDIIAGISLLSPSIMRLIHEKESQKYVDVLLSRRSLYIMTRSARYDYTHELLAKENSKFKNEVVKRGRRVSIICRNEPLPENKQ